MTMASRRVFPTIPLTVLSAPLSSTGRDSIRRDRRLLSSAASPTAYGRFSLDAVSASGSRVTTSAAAASGRELYVLDDELLDLDLDPRDDDDDDELNDDDEDDEEDGGDAE